jgi:hypothetical protein
MPATFNRLDPCGLYLSPNFALPSAINIAIRRFPSFEAGLEYLRVEVRPDSRKFYRIITESGAVFEGRDFEDRPAGGDL